MGQPVISPFIAEARVQRAPLAQLLGRFGLPDNDEDDEAGELRARRSEAGRVAARSRWNRATDVTRRRNRKTAPVSRPRPGPWPLLPDEALAAESDAAYLRGKPTHRRPGSR
jgi:hypothetical protein